jgi:hypothetical protein
MTRSQVRLEAPDEAAADDEFLLAVLNSTPVIDGSPTDDLADIDSARAWLLDAGGLGTEGELTELRRARSALQRIVRGEAPISTLAPMLRGVSYVPAAGEELEWILQVRPEPSSQSGRSWHGTRPSNGVRDGCGRARMTNASCS